VNLPSGIIVPLSAVIPTITPTSTWEKLARGENGVKPLVIDVRERSEFEGGHIPQVRLVEMPHLLNKSTILPQDREIILVCRSGRRSTQVTYALQEDGYQKVFNMDGGMIAWQAAGLPVVIE
jgi:rhodanese-related sulfurtransferase